MVPADFSISSSGFAVPTKPFCLHKCCVPKQAVTNRANWGSVVLGSSESGGEMAMVVLCCSLRGGFARAASWSDRFRQVASFSASVVF